MKDSIISEEQVYPPSFFANAGHPSCSIWGKTEIECVALAYVQALAADGDTWKKLTRQQTYDLLTEEQRRRPGSLLTMEYDRYESWFAMVSDQLSDSDGAFNVRGFWPRRPK